MRISENQVKDAIEGMIKALEFYSDRNNYVRRQRHVPSPLLVEADRGEKARAALSKWYIIKAEVER